MPTKDTGFLHVLQHLTPGRKGKGLLPLPQAPAVAILAIEDCGVRYGNDGDRTLHKTAQALRAWHDAPVGPRVELGNTGS